MLINRYGITLRLISEQDIEKIRQWRNQDHVRLNMQYQHPISKSEQIDWYRQLDKQYNFFFIIIYKEKEIGLIHLKDINKSDNSAEAGIFVGEKEYLNTYIPIGATVALMDFGFEDLKLTTLRAKISNQNEKAIKFNETLGYVYKNNINDDYDYYECSEENFIHNTMGLKKILQKF
ncbi:MAG: GNAT family N-acetyltransferase [Bacteroidetes bacterium]|nr:GNAT family N-acetyltransferase [Bacteroidota bacterium]